MTSKKEGPGQQKRSSAKPSYRVELSRTAEKALPAKDEKEMKPIAEIISMIRNDPFDRKHTLKLRGAWGGYRRADKGHWRVIYLSPEGDLVNVVYIRRRTEKTCRK